MERPLLQVYKRENDDENLISTAAGAATNVTSGASSGAALFVKTTTTTITDIEKGDDEGGEEDSASDALKLRLRAKHCLEIGAYAVIIWTMVLNMLLCEEYKKTKSLQSEISLVLLNLGAVFLCIVLSVCHYCA
jgi:hypothetical protein